MKFLITGNLGYVGSAVTKLLRHRFKDSIIVGFDSAYFSHCITGSSAPEHLLNQQIFGDIRNITPDILEDCTAIIHLAAISNDPMGNSFEQVTREINQDASAQLALAASTAGILNLVFASSCSVYGVAEGGARREGDPLNPVTAYAKSKVGTEEQLSGIDGDMTITCLRFATACGMSSRLRLDLVLNDFVACALSSGEISVLSDGTPWRPLIDTQDMAEAMVWAATRPPENGGRFLIVNAGANAANYQVRDLAAAVARHVPGTNVSINTSAAVDSRSYRVDFGLYAELAPDNQPRVTLDDSIAQLVSGMRGMGFADPDFRQSKLIRLRVLQDHISSGRLSGALKWQDDRP